MGVSQAVLWYCNALNHLAPSPNAFQEWKKSSFAQRRMLLKILLKFTVENQADIGMVSSNNVAAASTDLTGYKPSPFAVEVWDIRDWRKGS